MTEVFVEQPLALPQSANYKSEWNQPNKMSTTILQGGAKLAEGRIMSLHRAGGGR